MEFVVVILLEMEMLFRRVKKVRENGMETAF
jgi:hypothetical protein